MFFTLFEATLAFEAILAPPFSDRRLRLAAGVKPAFLVRVSTRPPVFWLRQCFGHEV
jgi:hypothetical protein